MNGGSWCKGASPELSVKIGPPAPLCETAKSGFDFRVQECHTSMKHIIDTVGVDVHRVTTFLYWYSQGTISAFDRSLFLSLLILYYIALPSLLGMSFSAESCCSHFGLIFILGHEHIHDCVVFPDCLRLLWYRGQCGQCIGTLVQGAFFNDFFAAL